MHENENENKHENEHENEHEHENERGRGSESSAVNCYVQESSFRPSNLNFAVAATVPATTCAMVGLVVFVYEFSDEHAQALPYHDTVSPLLCP